MRGVPLFSMILLSCLATRNDELCSYQNDAQPWGDRRRPEVSCPQMANLNPEHRGLCHRISAFTLSWLPRFQA